MLAVAVGMALGAGLDALVGDPRKGHPVAGFGRFAQAVERRRYKPSKASGVAFVAVTVGVPVLAAAAVAKATKKRRLATTALTAAATWAVLGGTSLRREATAMAAALDSRDLEAARA